MLQMEVREGHQDDEAVTGADAVRAKRLERLRQAQDQFRDWLYPDPETDEPVVEYGWEADELLDMLLSYYEQGHESKATDTYIDITVQWDSAIMHLRFENGNDPRITHENVQYGLRTLQQLNILEDSEPYLAPCPYRQGDLLYVHQDVRIDIDALVNGAYCNA